MCVLILLLHQLLTTTGLDISAVCEPQDSDFSHAATLLFDDTNHQWHMLSIYVSSHVMVKCQLSVNYTKNSLPKKVF